MKKIALLVSIVAILAGCAELPSASKQSLVNGDTTARPDTQEKVATSKGSLVPTTKLAASTYKGLFEERRAVRVGDMPDSSLVSVRLADNRRLCVATPAYLARHGTPQHPGDLARFDCLTLSSDASQTRGWAFKDPGGKTEVQHLKAGGPLDCSDGQVLHDWCLAGYGIAWRSTWEVENDIQSGQLVEVLADFAAPPNGIYGVFPQRKHLPLRLRLWIDFLKHHYSLPATWQSAP